MLGSHERLAEANPLPWLAPQPQVSADHFKSTLGADRSSFSTAPPYFSWGAKWGLNTWRLPKYHYRAVIIHVYCMYTRTAALTACSLEHYWNI